MRLWRARAGFTLAEIAITAAIMAILAAVTAPYLVEFIDKQRASTTADKLAALATGIAAFSSAVHTAAAATATAYPGRISELANVISTVAANTPNSCGAAFNTTAVAGWNTSGPFITFMVPTTGYVTPLGTVNDVLIRSPATTANVGTISMKIPAVDADDATELDKQVDGSDGASTGTIRWTTGAAAGTMDVTYIMPIAARC
jgi:prepilin-type N-terminal cleavage/methylation domain-containing protein